MDGNEATQFSVTAVVNNDEIHSLVARPEMTIKELTEICKALSPTLSQTGDTVIVFFNGRVLSDPDHTLRECGISSGDILAVNVVPVTDSQMENLMETIRSSGDLMNQLRDTNRELWSAINSSNAAEVRRLVPSLMGALTPFMRTDQQSPITPTVDHMAPEAQRAIEERINMDNINSMLAHAVEHFPESFGSVTMLFIKCKINNFETTAFVDTGAQATIMSQGFAERTNVMQMVDSRFRGTAMGVGTCKIVGRLHVAQVQIGDHFLPVSCMVVENQTLDLLIGLDVLRRYQCLINLKENCLIINGMQAPFLAEHEIPARFRVHALKETDGMANSEDVGGTSATRPRFPEADLTKVCSAGFTRTQAIEALERSNGNVKKAIAMLVVKHLDKA